MSAAVAEHVVAHEGAERRKVEVIPNGIDVDRWSQRAALKLDPPVDLPSRYAIFVGRYIHQKRIPWLIRLSQHPPFSSGEWKLVLVGDGPDKPLVEAAARRGELIDLGKRSDVPRLMRGAELLLLPSRYEGMPNVILEAMATAMPVVCSDAEGVRELLGPLSEHQVVARPRFEDFAAAVQKLLENDSLRLQLGAANQQRCRLQFTTSSMLQQYHRVIAEVLTKRT